MYIGNTADGAFTIEDPEGFSSSTSSRVEYHTMSDGSQSATVFGGLVSPTEFKLSFGTARAGVLSLMDSFSNNMTWYRRGTGLQFCTPYGERTNYLTYDESTLRYIDLYQALPVELDDGYAMGYVAGNTYRRYFCREAPMPKDQTTVRVSLYVRGTASVQVVYRDATGAATSSNSREYTTTGGKFQRVTGLYTLDKSATYFDVNTTGEFTRPSVSFGPEENAWSEGQRFPSVVVEKTSNKLVGIIERCTSLRYEARDYTIRELRRKDA